VNQVMKAANTQIAWQFALQPGDLKENEQTQEEFFSNEETINEVSSLVRESIQNSLDERLDSEKPVRMIFTIGVQEGSVGSKYFNSLASHIDQVKELEKPDFNKPFKYLLIEDFNTLGLEGGVNSIARTDEELDKIERDLLNVETGYKESFWFFEWKSGGSNKKNGAKGSWGVGKIVFPRASAIKTYLVYTVRRKMASPDAAESLLFGHAIYNYRYVNGYRYVPDCQWMVKNSNRFVTTDGKLNPFPSEDLGEQSEFIADWNLARTNQETGTSILVPYCKEAVEAKSLLECIARDYFINILSGTLECEVRDVDGTTVVLTKENLRDQIATFEGGLTTRTTKGGTSLDKLCLLYLAKLSGETTKFEIDFDRESKNDWSKIKLTDEAQQALESDWSSGKVLEIVVNTNVPETTDSKRNVLPPEEDRFTILLQRTSEKSPSTVYCREGILIPNANNTSKLPECLSLVLIGNVAGAGMKQNSLANLLKWSEGPAHTTWTSTASKFKNRYKPKVDGESTIRWVKNSAETVFDLIRRIENLLDEKSLSDYAPDDDDMGIGVIPPLSKTVHLRYVANASIPTEGKLIWDLRNGLKQDSAKIYEFCPNRNVIHQTVSEKSHDLAIKDLWQKRVFQVEVQEGANTYISNRVVVDARASVNDLVLVVDNFVGSNVDGFTIMPLLGTIVQVGDLIEVKAAYASRTNTNWSSEDFILKNRLDHNSMKGLVEEPSEDEFSILKVVDPDFSATWVGFDRLRELSVSATKVKV